MHEADLALVQALAERNVDLRSMLAEHRVENQNEILPHLFMGDVVRWLQQIWTDPRRRGEVEGVLNFLDSEFVRSEFARELIAVSFLENLPLAGEPGSEIREILGPSLVDELRRLEGG